MFNISPIQMKRIERHVVEKIIKKHKQANLALFTARKKFIASKNAESINKFRFLDQQRKQSQEKEKERAEARTYIKRASTYLRSALTRPVLYPSSTPKQSVFQKASQLSNGSFQLPKGPCSRSKLTEGPVVLNMKKSWRPVTPKMDYIKAVIKIQRSIRSFLFRKRINALIMQRTIEREEGVIPAISQYEGILSPTPKKKPKSPKNLQKHANRLFSFIKTRRPYISEEVIEECKAAINTVDSKGNTPLYYAAKFNNFELVNSLLRKGARVNAKNEDKFTALHVAMQGNQRGISGLLISHGADIHAVNIKGDTPLVLAPGKLLEDLGLSHVLLKKKR